MPTDPIPPDLGLLEASHATLYDDAQGPPAQEHTRTRKWVEWMTRQLYPDRPAAAEDPVTDLLVQPFNEVEQIVREWYDEFVVGEFTDVVVAGVRIPGTFYNAQRAALACCMLRSVIDFVQRDEVDLEGNRYGRGQTAAIDFGEWWYERTVDMSKVRRYLELIRALVVMARSDRTGFTARISLQLSGEVSSAIFGVLEQVLAAPAVAALLTIERVIDDLLAKIYGAVASTKCFPILRLLNLVMSWLWRHPMGFVTRLRGFTFGTLVRSRREFRALFDTGSADIEIGTGTDRGLQLFNSQADDLIAVLDALISATHLLARCPMPRRRRPDDAPVLTEYPVEPPPPPWWDIPPGTGGPDPGDPVNPGGPGTVDPPDPTIPPGTTTPPPPGGTTTGPTRPPEPGDPFGIDTGWITPSNLADIYVTAFGLSPVDAARMANTRNCAGDLTPAAKSALARLGISTS